MTFSVKYRAKDGSIAEVAIEAADRGDCFTKCKARGIAVVELKVESGMLRVGGGESRRVGDNAPYQRERIAARPESAPYRSSARPTNRSLGAKLLIVGILLMAGAIVWLMLPKDAPQEKAEIKKARRSGLAQEVTPARAPQPKESPKKMKPRTREERLAWFEKKYGTNIPENLKATVYFLKNPPQKTFRPKPRREDIFKHHSEKTLAGLLLHTPGTFMIQRTVYDESFDRDFIKSLEEPIIVEDGDDEETRELKNAVNDVKAELAERMRAGEKPSDIVNEIMNTAYELGKYSRNVEEMVRDAMDDPSKTDEDVEDFVKAANRLLKEKGAKEMEMPNLFRRQIRLKMLSRKARQEKESTEKGGN